MESIIFALNDENEKKLDDDVDPDSDSYSLSGARECEI